MSSSAVWARQRQVKEGLHSSFDLDNTGHRREREVEQNRKDPEGLNLLFGLYEGWNFSL